MKKGADFYDNKGISLLEILITISIISIMGSVVFVSYSSRNLETKVVACQNEVASAIKLAQDNALLGVAVNGVAPCGYGFRFVDQSTYAIYYNLPTSSMDCRAMNNDSTRRKFNGSSGESDYKLSNNVASSVTGDVTDVYFTAPHGDMFYEGVAPASDFALALGLTLSGNIKTVTVNSQGRIAKN